MRLKAITGILLTVLLISMLTFAFNIQQAGSSEPPATEWTKTYGGTSWDVANSFVETSDGGYALAGFTSSFGVGLADFWLVKVDSYGNHQWNKTYGGTSGDAAQSVVETVDGGYAIAGYTHSYGAGDADFWLVKVDSSGNMQWNRTYGGADYDRAQSVVEASDGGYAIAGYTKSFGAGGYDFWLVKTDADGNMEWNKAYGGASWDVANSFVETSDGGYISAGYTESFGERYEDFWLVKVDANGNMQWNKTYGGTSADRAHSVLETSDGGYAIAGYTESFGEGSADFWLVKTDSHGNEQWSKTYGGADWDEAHSVVEASDGGYAIAGRTASFGAGSYDFWLVKTDADGNMEWNKAYGGDKIDVAQSVQQTSDGGYAIAGYTWSFGAGYEDFWLVKVAGGPTPDGEFGLLVFYIGLALTVILVIVAIVVFVRLRKRKQ